MAAVTVLLSNDIFILKVKKKSLYYGTLCQSIAARQIKVK